MTSINKIVSISVYGNKPQYIQGAYRQIELVQEMLPEWIVRIYTDNPTKFTSTNNLQVEHVHDGSYGMFWRFRPMFEDTNNVVLSRDSDSRFTLREVQAINEWLSSDKQLHVIKDHQAHYEWPINGGLWGYKGKLSDQLQATLKYWSFNTDFYTADQIWLKEFLAPAEWGNCLVHSMRDDSWFAHTRNQLKNPFSFCGNGYDEHDMPLYPYNLSMPWDPKNVPTSAKFDKGILVD